MTFYFEAWKLVQERISTLLWNGITGLLLVIATLYFFLNARVAWWVTVGIPVSFMATLGLVWLFGGTINMISLFGLILALGIIVDDAIVVGRTPSPICSRGIRPARCPGRCPTHVLAGGGLQHHHHCRLPATGHDERRHGQDRL